MSSKDAEWSKHKEEVSSLYRKNPLNRVMKHMIAKHGFHRKESEYKKKLKAWGVRKNGFRGGITTLQAALFYGNLVSLKVILDKQGDVHAPAGPEDGLTALHAAIQNKDLAAHHLLEFMEVPT
ncbi:hypothetical protein AtubIFM55763_006085 [Aspergillus tubingensis]|nr:hypothetical protein AtubIFM55763_006085 [Aspergillus tubingensis]